MFVQTYAPGQTVVTFSGSILTGFGDEIVSCKRNSDVFATVQGADGEVARCKSADKTGEVQITVKQTSVANSILGALLKADELLGAQVGALLVSDNLGNTIWSGEGWIKGWPETKRGKDAGDQVWTIVCKALEFEFAALPANV